MPDFRFEANRQIGLWLPFAQQGRQSGIVFGIHDGLKINEIVVQKREIASSTGYGTRQKSGQLFYSFAKPQCLAQVAGSIGRLHVTVRLVVPACATVGPARLEPPLELRAAPSKMPPFEGAEAGETIWLVLLL